MSKLGSWLNFSQKRRKKKEWDLTKRRQRYQCGSSILKKLASSSFIPWLYLILIHGSKVRYGNVPTVFVFCVLHDDDGGVSVVVEGCSCRSFLPSQLLLLRVNCMEWWSQMRGNCVFELKRRMIQLWGCNRLAWLLVLYTISGTGCIWSYLYFASCHSIYARTLFLKESEVLLEFIYLVKSGKKYLLIYQQRQHCPFESRDQIKKKLRMELGSLLHDRRLVGILDVGPVALRLLAPKACIY